MSGLNRRFSMKGLLIKDFCLLKNYFKIPIAVFVVLSVLSCLNGGSMASGVLIMMFMVMAITSFSHDEYAKWDNFILSTPVSRRIVVSGKYIVSVLLILTGVVISLLTSLMVYAFGIDVNLAEQLIVVYFVTVISFIFISIILPVLYKFGVEKGRLVMFIICFTPMILTTIMSRLSLKMPGEDDLWLLPFFIPALLMGSYLISCGIYLKKEF